MPRLTQRADDAPVTEDDLQTVRALLQRMSLSPKPRQVWFLSDVQLGRLCIGILALALASKVRRKDNPATGAPLRNREGFPKSG